MNAAEKALEVEMAWRAHLGSAWTTPGAKRKLRRRLAGQQGWRCCYCGVRMEDDNVQVGPNSATLEHVLPKAWGGSDREDNLAVACNRCNGARGSAQRTAAGRASLMPLAEALGAAATE